MVFMLTTFAGCTKKDLGDSYVDGSDYQYMYANEWNMITQQKGTRGNFFWNGHCIYYLDDATKQCVPLCNKADCLHNKETDEEKAEKCNAYVTRTPEMGAKILYADGYLYVVDVLINEENLDDYYVLYRMKEDGSEKEQIYKWEEETIIDYCIHRNTIYYIEKIFIEDEKKDSADVKEEYCVKKLDLSGMKKPVLIYEPEQELEVYTVDKLQAYGNHVYFMIDASKDIEGIKITDDNYVEYMYFKYWHYNILTGKLEELMLPDRKKNENVSGITFWQDKLIIMPYLSGADYETETNIYIAELDGSKPEELLTAKQGLSYVSDGTYLYEYNFWMVEEGLESENLYKVYDEKMNVIDIFKTPFRELAAFSLGHPEGLYYMEEREDDSGCKIMYFDKSTIGTYQGASFENKAVSIAEHDYSKWDKDTEDGE